MKAKDLIKSLKTVTKETKLQYNRLKDKYLALYEANKKLEKELERIRSEKELVQSRGECENCEYNGGQSNGKSKCHGCFLFKPYGNFKKKGGENDI
jgi:predicted Zn-ribbon and HTH transcriptional regulator